MLLKCVSQTNRIRTVSPAIRKMAYVEFCQKKKMFLNRFIMVKWWVCCPTIDIQGFFSLMYVFWYNWFDYCLFIQRKVLFGHLTKDIILDVDCAYLFRRVKQSLTLKCYAYEYFPSTGLNVSVGNPIVKGKHLFVYLCLVNPTAVIDDRLYLSMQQHSYVFDTNGVPYSMYGYWFK